MIFMPLPYIDDTYWILQSYCFQLKNPFFNQKTTVFDKYFI